MADKRGLAGALDRAEGGALRGILSALYGGACALDRARYRAGLARTRILPRPVISVGNLTVGGGGKTPLVLWLVRVLEARGLSVVVLSRGYGRRGGHPARVVPTGDPARDAAAFGDEPLLIQEGLGKGRVYVGPSRFRSGSLALSDGDADVFLLDDGFQHRALGRDLDILVVDDSRRFGNGKLLPAGILREPPWRLAQADAVVVTKSPGPDPEFAAVLGGIAPIPVFWAGLKAASVRRLPKGEHASMSALAAKPLLAFSGIADPASFDDTLHGAGLNVVASVHYADHHPYSYADAADLERTAALAGAEAFITTEKDAARWPGNTTVPCYALRAELVLHGGEDRLAAMAVAAAQREDKRRA